MTNEELIAKVLRIHYYLMDNPRFWYENGLKVASTIFCIIASDTRANVEVSNLRQKAGIK